MSEDILGVIGGTGLSDIEGLEGAESKELETPFGKPSGPYLCGTLHGTRVAFLPRHGPGHVLMPTEVNYRANIHGFRQLGVRYVLSVSAVGSLKEDIHPGDMVLPAQFIDRTRGRVGTLRPPSAKDRPQEASTTIATGSKTNNTREHRVMDAHPRVKAIG